MDRRVFRLVFALGVALLGIVLFGAFASLAAASSGSTTDSSFSSQDVSVDLAIGARRAISIPFGIDSPLFLSQDGSLIQVTGHAECRDESERFRIRVMATQDATGARANANYTEFGCDVSTWGVLAEAQGPKLFEAGPAEVCAMAIEFGSPDGAIVMQWCRDVDLVQ